MRSLFGLVGILVVLAIVGVLVKKQLASTQQAIPALQLPATAGAPAVSPGRAGPDQARPDAARLPPNVSNRTLARLVHGWFTTVAPG